jgi:hypothetical protein
MNAEARQCQNCKAQFTIESEDFDFYKKIDVPPPTWCPKCRLMRRLAWFNMFALYKRPCDLCKKEYFSVYYPGTYVAYCPKCWWSDEWDQYKTGRDYDFSRPFLEQFNELLHVAPLLGLSLDLPTAESSPYTSNAGHLKNSYLVFQANHSENCAHSFGLVNAKSIFDSALVHSCEQCFDNFHTFKDFGCIGVEHTNESINCFFTRDCVNCQDCFGSANLRNKQFYIFNEPYSKEEYFKKLKDWDLGSWTGYEKAKEAAHEHWKKYPPRPRWDNFSVNISGNYVFDSKNCKDCFEVELAENSKYLFWLYEAPGVKDSYDITNWGEGIDLSYESSVVGTNVSRLMVAQETGINVINAQYCKMVSGSSNCFGCVGMKKAEHCILNRKYSKEEYKSLKSKIIDQMNKMPYRDSRGLEYRYGEFFPPQISPHSYNETLAQSFFPLDEAEAQLNGYLWREQDVRSYQTTKNATELPDNIKDATDTVLEETWKCITCGRGYRIIQMEIQFLRAMNIALSRECVFCRIDHKFKRWMNELKITQRLCSKCGVSSETSFTPEEALILFCKQCYNEALG